MYEIYRNLINRFKEGQLTTYGEVADWLGKPKEAEFIDRYFIEIDEIFKENGQPPLSSFIINTDKGICGDGYFKEHFGADKRERDIIWIEQLQKFDTVKALELIKR
jgi:hypothetical protein